MSGRVGAWRRLVKADAGLTARDKLVGLTLVEHRWQPGTFSRREHDLAAELGMHPSSVFRSLRALADGTYLRVVVAGRKGVQQVYELTFPADDSGRRPCIADTPTQVGARADLKAHSAMHRAVAEPGSQLCASAYPSLLELQTGPSSSQVPAHKTKGGTKGECTATRVRNSTHQEPKPALCSVCGVVLDRVLVAAGELHPRCAPGRADDEAMTRALHVVAGAFPGAVVIAEASG